MISKKSIKNECYVYMTLPEQVAPVTAGKFILETTPSGENVGRFVYGKSYLARFNAVPIDPVELKLTDKVYETTIMKGVFGAIRDASPDYWGRRLIERHISKPNVSELDYLLNSPDDRIGALGFGLNQTPPAPKRTFNKVIDLERLQQTADELIREEAAQDSLHIQVEELMLLGTSMGGARPKAVVFSDNSLYVAKFNCATDRWNNAIVEHAMLLLASVCGLNAAESKVVQVGDRDVLLVKRFDRESTVAGYLRHRMISALTVLRASDETSGRDKWSYVSLAEELRKFSAVPKEDAKELFRRMVFNALISNTDDHPRNHAFIAKDRWRLSPAYDLTPNPVISLEHRDLAMQCGQQGRFASKSNLLSECRRLMLEPDEAMAIIDTMADVVKNSWYKLARKAGLSERECELIQGAFVYQGFFS
ncbi:type II toxin-antitoxin system HipA family toxin [Deferribacterales bacterium RsTz2092]|nr:phosphatidylinositol kinase [Deferribacterales bacterium]